VLYTVGENIIAIFDTMRDIFREISGDFFEARFGQREKNPFKLVFKYSTTIGRYLYVQGLL
jgi:hypothetical protein